MKEKQFDKEDVTSGKLARMDDRARRRYLERKVYRKFKEFSPSRQKIKKSFFGASPPSIFVGRYGYPKVNAGILSPVEHQASQEFDSPGQWYGDNSSIEQIIGYRSSLVNSRSSVKVHDTSTFLDSAKEIAMASRPVDMEVELKKKPTFQLNFDTRSAPFGPAENIEKVELAENPNISRAVDKAVYDTDWKAEGAARYMYKKDIDTYGIQRVLSAGLLGEEEKRRMVPTRWSITATDDILGKGLREEVRDFQELGEHRLFVNYYNGNLFNVLLIPGRWEYEIVEIKGAGSVWNPGKEAYIKANYEGFEGRTSYAKETAGAFYAARLGVLEYLRKIRRQAKVFIVRDVTDEYWAPLGVWVIRETVRNAFDDGEYETVQSFSQGVERIKNNISVPIEQIKKNSRMMAGMQSSIGSFLAN